MPAREFDRHVERSNPVPARRDWFQATILMALACLVFLWQPITAGEWFGAGDVSALSPVLRADGVEPGSIPQIDVTIDVLPWTTFSTDQIRSGNLPTWNPYNNSGVPHLANIQSAVFSPFSVPFYVLPMRLALLASSFLLLMTAGALTYGLTRHLRGTHLAGLVSSLAYMFCGYMVFWHRWPLAAVAAWLPGLLWATSALVRAPDRRKSVASGGAVAAVVAAMVFAGHPETMFYGVAAAVSLGIAVLVHRRTGVRTLVVKMAHLAAAGAAGAALAAVQLIPFLEYLAQSPTWAGRSVPNFQSPRWLSVQAYPLAHGSPSMTYKGLYNFVVVFHETVILYVGFIAVLLAGVALCSPLWTRRRAPIFFGALLGLATIYVYDVIGLGRLISRLPVLDVSVPSRVGSTWALCVAVLAGFGVDALRAVAVPALDRRRRRIIIGVVASGLVALSVLAYRAWRISHYADYRSPESAELAWTTLRDHVAFVVVIVLIGVGAILVVALSRRTSFRRVAAAALILMVFVEGGFLLRGQNASVPAERFRNFAPRVHQIADEVGTNQSIWIDRATMLPDLNLWIPTFMPDNYDVIGIDTYDRLYWELLHEDRGIVLGSSQLGMLAGPYAPDSIHALKAMGIRRIVTNRDYPFTDKVIRGSQADESRADGGGVHTYRWDEAVPSQLLVSTDNVSDGAVIEAIISSVELDEPVETQLEIHGGLGVTDLPEELAPHGELEVNFLWPGDESPQRRGGKITESTLAVTPTTGLELVGSVDGYRIFTVPGPSGFVVSPGSAEFVDSNDEAFARVTDPEFDPVKTVVIEGPAPDRSGDAGSGEAGRIRDVRFAPGRVSATVTRDSPGQVLLTQNFVPGWRATVNGHEVEVQRANSTYQAVPVPSGTSEVTFYYDPASVRIGAVLSIVTLLGGIVALAATRARREPRA